MQLIAFDSQATCNLESMCLSSTMEIMLRSGARARITQAKDVHVAFMAMNLNEQPRLFHGASERA